MKINIEIDRYAMLALFVLTTAALFTVNSCSGRVDGGVDGVSQDGDGVSQGGDSSSTTDGVAGTSDTAAVVELGEPSSTLFNGLLTVLDPFTRNPLHAIAAVYGDVPSALAAENKPRIPDLKTLNRRDALIIYLPNVKGAADYRAYVVPTQYATTANGVQPRGAVVACAGYRQHIYPSDKVDTHNTRQLLQTIELPGFVSQGTYSVVVEAITTPCPFVGMFAHSDAQITMQTVTLSDGSTTNFPHVNQPETYFYTGVPVAVMKSFNTVMSQYGNEIINGQGASIDWRNRESVPKFGEAVAANDAIIPSDPVVIGRSVITVPFPAADEDTNAPVISNLGGHAIEENFETDAVVAQDTKTMSKNPDYADAPADAVYPAFKFNGKWQFWGRNIQPADKTPGISAQNDPGYVPFEDWTLKAIQVFSRHGRLYTTFGDIRQDVGGSLSFSSLDQPVVEMDGQKYVHSMFRVNAESSHRRYWYWTICGGDSSAALFDTATKSYKIRPLLGPSSFDPGGFSLTVPDTQTLGAEPSDDVRAIECLSITEEGRHANYTDIETEAGKTRSSGEIRAQIHPKGKKTGIISLGNTSADNGGTLGFRYKVDAAGKYAGPVLEPFDQVAPLTHFDIFLRSDRMVLFVNGRQAACVDMSDIPLTMKYAIIGYGDLIYHSSVEWQELSTHLVGGTDSANNKDSQMYHHQLNTPIASMRAWDLVAHADKMEIPTAQFTTFDPTLCRKPSNQNIQ